MLRMYAFVSFSHGGAHRLTIPATVFIPYFVLYTFIILASARIPYFGSVKTQNSPSLGGSANPTQPIAL